MEIRNYWTSVKGFRVVSRARINNNCHGNGVHSMLVVDRGESPVQMKWMNVSLFFPSNTHLLISLWVAIQVEWAKTKACTDYCDEEYMLSVEEMRHTIMFCDWKAHWWLRHTSIHTDISIALQSGLRAYAHKQAAVYQGLTHSFAHKWYPLLIVHNIPIQWPAIYIPAATSSSLTSCWASYVLLVLTIHNTLLAKSLMLN